MRRRLPELERSERPPRLYVPMRLDETDGGDRNIDELGVDERGDDAAGPVGQQVAAQDRGRGTRTVAHALERRWNEQDDDQDVEDRCGRDGALRHGQVHDV